MHFTQEYIQAIPSAEVPLRAPESHKLSNYLEVSSTLLGAQELVKKA